MSYEILTAAIFAVFAVLFAFKMNGLNRLLVAGVIAWPFAMVAADHTTLAPYIPHLIAGIVAFVLMFILFAKVGIGGGVAKGATLIALWTPTGLLFDVFTSIGILGALLVLVMSLVTRRSGDDKVEHYATMMFAVAAGVLIYKSQFGLP